MKWTVFKERFKESIFTAFSIKQVMIVCLIILLSGIGDIYKAFFLKEEWINIQKRVFDSAWFIVTPLLFGVILIWHGWYQKWKNEKLAFYMFGVNFFLSTMTNIRIFLEKGWIIFIPVICFLLNLGATLNLWKCYDKHFKTREVSEKINVSNEKLGKRRLWLIFLWLIAIMVPIIILLYYGQIFTR